MPDSKKGSNRYSALPEIPKEFESPQQFSQLVMLHLKQLNHKLELVNEETITKLYEIETKLNNLQSKLEHTKPEEPATN
ncbi:hypothetical protein CONCODRAFT_78918 [Conidiobolus coronatus NRRL 28638]|uniref:Uncharacterized protein n=1 Tax=Conidiobolus coronatus (strain ATCC 28846 / CBS 209.66 / NRRL 28638) TaxID=796925 RepID=A0A137P5L8_CONC2|nr:hypothetical protein CONCODRAFT_78918 [Conidiobolus coronatus NRRL 28638]|eukprot:KXN70310.1 hypothetical protein CONCODRAFT_78918 [Conidiobolus coronatus NRRL 28638]